MPAPKPCPQLKADQSEYLDILRSVRSMDGVKKGVYPLRHSV